LSDAALWTQDNVYSWISEVYLVLFCLFYKCTNRSWTVQEKVSEKGNQHCMLHWQQLT